MNAVFTLNMFEVALVGLIGFLIGALAVCALAIIGEELSRRKYDGKTRNA